MSTTTRSISDLIPHAEPMVLIDEVLDFDQDRIHCRAHTGSPTTHPLSVNSQIPGEVLAEYGAQAIAVHGGLLSPPDSPPRPGRLVALGRLELTTSNLTKDHTLLITAHCLSGDQRGQLYDFEVFDLEKDSTTSGDMIDNTTVSNLSDSNQGRRRLASGRATIMFADQKTQPNAEQGISA